MVERFLVVGQQKIFVIGLLLCFVVQNVFQSLQYKRQLIHHDGMSWEAYKYTFLKLSLTEAEKAHYKTLVKPANYTDTGKKLSEYFKKEK
jgi:hypothetical protein